MNWLVRIFGSSIGRKLLMAVTGLGFCGFLAMHLAGNLTLYAGSDAFGAYVVKLHGLGPLITLAELVLLLFAVVHVTTGLWLFYENVTARPVRYQVNKRAGGRTLGSATMPYTGLLLLGFIVLHLIDFHFADRTEQSLFQIVAAAFENPNTVVVYMAAMVVAAVHVSHGFWSAFQTIGANHPRYMPLIRGTGIVFSVMIGAGFGFIPVVMSLMS